MSIKTTQRIKRKQAIEILMAEIPLLPNSALEKLMDALADSEQSRTCSIYDNFIVSDFFDESSN